MAAEMQTSAGVEVIRLHGELDTHNAASIKEQLARVLREGKRRLVVDLSQVTYMDSAALGAIVSGFKQARLQHAQFKLAGVNGPVAKIFELTRLSRFFEIHPDVESAARSFE